MTPQYECEMNTMENDQIRGLVVDIHRKRIYPGILNISDGRIQSITETDEKVSPFFILPGFIDAHVHIESSMLVPSEFARLAVRHGTVATVSDPHEIANVLGVKGVEFMIENGLTVPFKFYFGAPSCVPATTFETAGATIDLDDIRYLLDQPEILYLSEMMNWPGVLHRDPVVMDKINASLQLGKPVDGHAPGLMGSDALRYVEAGISTDHECYTLQEALDKLEAGMKIIIREGSAARNFEALIPLMEKYSEHLMFCSDDKHPDELITGHINELVRESVRLGYDLFDVLRVACVNPVDHYGLQVGVMRIGDPADFVMVRDLVNFEVLETYIDGNKVFGEHGIGFSTSEPPILNRFDCQPISMGDIQISTPGQRMRIIEALDGEIITKSSRVPAFRNSEGALISNTEEDILKIVVVNRYQNAKPAVAFIRGFGLKTGAIASTIAHDSHNLIAVGANDEAIVKCINNLIEVQGGISVVSGSEEYTLPLPVAGLMSTRPGEEIAREYKRLDLAAKQMGSTLRAPFMTLSFMALLVIPELKLSDLGLFDGRSFAFADLVEHS